MEGAAGAGDDAEAPCERRLPFARVVPAEGAGPGGRFPGRCGDPGGAELHPGGSERRGAHTRGGGGVRPSGLLQPGGPSRPWGGPAQAACREGGFGSASTWLKIFFKRSESCVISH